MGLHELREVLGRVLAALALLQQVAQVAEHIRHPRAVLVRRVLERLLHPPEARVERVTAQQILDLRERLLRVGRLPVIAAQLGHRGRGGIRQVLHLHLTERPVRVVHRDVPRELAPLREHRLVEQLLHLVDRPAQAVALQQRTASALDVAGEVVETARVRAAPTQILPQRLVRAVAGHDVVGHRRQRLRQVDRRRKGVRTAGEAAVPSPPVLSHRPTAPPPSPSTASVTGRGPRAPARSPRRAVPP